MQRALLVLSAVVVAAGCGADADAVTITGAWARTSAAGQTTGAIYFDVTVDRGDTLLRASVPSSVAGRAEVHEVVKADIGESMDDMSDTAGSDDMDGSMEEGMDGDHGTDGAMVMRELTDGLPIAAGETVAFEPGGYHVMLLDIVEPLEVGDEIELTLEFEDAGPTTLTVDVARGAP